MRLGRIPFFAPARPAQQQVPQAAATDPAASDPAAEPVETPAPPPPPLTPSSARRERRALIRRREVELRDVGGLAVEMVRREQWKPDLLHSRCNDVLMLEQRVYDLDSYLATAEAVPAAMRQATLCRCGAPLVRGAHFCSHCGRPASETPAVVACEHCGNPLAADTNFCSFCGNAVAAPEIGDEGEKPDIDETMVRDVEDTR